MEPLATALVAALLLGAAGLKALDRTATAVAFEALGLHGPAARRTVVGLVALEAATAIALLAGARGSAAGAAGLFGGFVVAQLVLLATGRRGAPCGCLGRGSRLGPSSLARAALPGAPGPGAGAHRRRRRRAGRAGRPRPSCSATPPWGRGRPRLRPRARAARRRARPLRDRPAGRRATRLMLERPGLLRTLRAVDAAALGLAAAVLVTVGADVAPSAWPSGPRTPSPRAGCSPTSS